MQHRIGIDVGGTNTDAVLMQGQEVVGWVKTPTTADVTSGIVTALQELLQQTSAVPSDIRGVMLGTTHFTNAVVQRRHLSPVAAVRLGLPATACVPPLTDWPEDLRELVGQATYMLPGGHEVDGRPIVPFEPQAMERVAYDIKACGITDVAITSVFSPVDASLERQAAAIVQHVVPDATVTLSCDIGRLGLLECENAAVMNACLRRLGRTTVQAFRQALAIVGLHAPLFLTQNDGTLMSAAYAQQYPVLTFASGPTNSMRGAAFLTGVADAMVIDIGGTTADIGALIKGFPRPASLAVEVGGMGAPTVSIERIIRGDAILYAVRALERHVGRRVDALISKEIGGSNSMRPMLAAALGDLPVVDGDGMGRAFPELQMCTFFIYGLPAAPAALCDIRHNVVLFDEVRDAFWLERMARAVTIQMGCHAAYAMAPWSGAEIKRTAVPHTVTQARAIGAVVLEARRHQENPIPPLVASQGGRVLFEGKIVDVLRRVTGGFARGEVTIEGLDDSRGQHLTIDFQNENLIARCGETVLCTVPDLICILERDSGTPINTELLRYGFRVVVVAFPAPAQLTSAQALQVVGPQAFGYDVPYRPLVPSSSPEEGTCAAAHVSLQSPPDIHDTQ